MDNSTPEHPSKPPLSRLRRWLDALLFPLILVVAIALALLWGRLHTGAEIDLAPVIASVPAKQSPCPAPVGPYHVLCSGPNLTVLILKPATNEQDLALIQSAIAYAHALGADTVCLTWAQPFNLPPTATFDGYSAVSIDCYTTFTPVPSIGG